MQTIEGIYDYMLIDLSNLKEECTKLPANLMVRQEEYARAIERHLLTDCKVQSLKGKLYIECRELLESEGAKVTESKIGAAVEQHPELITARGDRARAKADETYLRGVVEALKAKKEMLTAITRLEGNG